MYPTPRSIYLNITDRCNLRCKYCAYYSSANEVGKELPKQEWLKFFKELKKNAVINVILQGGEPFFRKDIKELIRGIIINRMRFAILTNGTLVTRATAEFLKKSKRCDYLQVSVDGSNARIHDSVRGKGSFKKVIRAIKILKAYNLPVHVRSVIVKENFRDLEGIAELLVKKMGIKSLTLTAAVFTGLCKHNYATQPLSRKEHNLLIKEIRKLDKKYPGVISHNAAPLNDIERWRIMEKKRMGEKPISREDGFVHGCFAINNVISVRADGTFVPCVFLSHIELGKVNKNSLKRIWQHSPELKALRKKRLIPMKKIDFCKGCSYTDYCTSNCPGLSHIYSSTIKQPDLQGCLRDFIESGGILKEVL